MKYCKNCGAQLRENSRFCSVCGAPCVPVPDRTTAGSQSAQAEEKRVGTKLPVLIAVLAAGLLLMAGILIGILLDGGNGEKADRHAYDEEESRDHDDRTEEDAEKGEIVRPDGTDLFKLVAGTRLYFEDVLENTVSYGYNESGQLVFYEKRYISYEHNYEETIRFEYAYDKKGNVISADVTTDDTAVTFDYTYEDGRVVSCIGTTDGTTATLLYGTIDGGRILDVRMYVDGEMQEYSASASYDGHGCLERAMVTDDSVSSARTYDCEGHVIGTEQFSSWDVTGSETDYDEDGRLTAVRQYRSNELISETLYHYNDSKDPALCSMTVTTEGTVYEMPFEWRGNVGVWESDPSPADGSVTVRTVRLDEDGDFLSICDESEGFRMENATTYINLELPAGMMPSNPNDLIYLHNLLVL